MDMMQALWMADERGRLAEAEHEALGGRISGPADWKAMRDELGLQTMRKPAIRGERCSLIISYKLIIYPVLTHLPSTLNGVETLGDAEVKDGCIVLTSGSSQHGAAYHPTTLSQTQSYRLQTTFRLTAPPGSGGADGISVIVCHEKKLGLGGYGMGYSGLGGHGDFAVESEFVAVQDGVSILMSLASRHLPNTGLCR